jgi:hypothetical protein
MGVKKEAVKMTLLSPETSGSDYPLVQRHVPEEVNPQRK